ncbi:MAG: ABC transporter ATP-binding protein [Flavobacteriales bacterium]|nr:ABC transporter ATP-binding protein [Flavobacteriales bacterium]
MILAKNIKKAYGDLQVLKGVNIEVDDAEVVSIVGDSGAGKTTLLQILGTLDRPDSGSLSINGEDLNAMSRQQLASFRNRRIGFIFQFHHLLPEFTALENVCMPAFIGGKNKAESEKKAMILLDRLNIKPRSDHKPNQLSGGEQQRVAVARALMNDPAVIFADEPSGNLDSKNAEQLHKLFFDLRDEFKQTFVIVTHNKELAQMADRTLEMVDGKFENTVKERLA